MKKILTTFLAAMTFITLMAQNTEPIQLHVNAAKQIGTAKATFNGTNIEDLNNQTNGGVFSQLIHGEAFEENIDIDPAMFTIPEGVKVQDMDMSMMGGF